jgi:DNA-binding response OmpR family regulator
MGDGDMFESYHADHFSECYDPEFDPLGNVLIIEDSKDTADLMSVLLKRHGFDVRTAIDRDAAVFLMGQYHYDCIIMDFMMNGMTAEEFLSKVPESFARIVLTTSSDYAKPLQRKLGLRHVLGKPFSAEDLLQVAVTCRDL